MAAGYALFALAAGARGAVQLLTDAGRAPLAYALSVGAGLTYLAGALLLAGADRRPRLRAAACALAAAEFGGVLAVGTLSVLVPSAFPDATVWSWYGAGYGFVPLVLPLLALLWGWISPCGTRARGTGRPAARGRGSA
nr:hypothetical protein [Actinomadura rayongensis]